MRSVYRVGQLLDDRQCIAGVVAALLKVDPAGITGQSEKHRKKDEAEKD